MCHSARGLGHWASIGTLGAAECYRCGHRDRQGVALQWLNSSSEIWIRASFRHSSSVPRKNGRSAEAEHRALLEELLWRPKGKRFAEALASMPNVGED